MEIRRADISQLEQIAKLFSDYKVFYHCQSNIDLAREFIAARLAHNESVIFLALENGKALGFTQLYPSFCSVEVCRIMILYDLFVAEDARKSGVATELMNAARAYAESAGAKRIDLSTQNTNTPGQRLYEKQGYQRTGEDLYIYTCKSPQEAI